MKTLIAFLLLASCACAQEIAFTKMPTVQFDYDGPGDAYFLALLRAVDLPGTNDSYDVRVTLYVEAEVDMVQQYVAVCSSDWETMSEGSTASFTATDTTVIDGLDVTGPVKVSYEARTPTTPKGTGALVDANSWEYDQNIPSLGIIASMGLEAEDGSTFDNATNYAQINLYLRSWDQINTQTFSVDIHEWDYVTEGWYNVGTFPVTGGGESRATYKSIGTILTKPPNWPSEAVQVRCRYTYLLPDGTKHNGQTWVGIQPQ